jgi:hypothetical protein
MTEEWMQDPAIAHIDKAKLDFLQALVFESQSLSKEKLLPFLLSVAKKGQEHNVSFDNEEMNLIIETIRQYSTPEEIDRIDKLMRMRQKKV